MIRDDDDPEQINEVLRIAQALAHAQEAEIKRMRAAGLDVKQAEALLSAYREALRLAAEHNRRLKDRLETRPVQLPATASKRQHLLKRVPIRKILYRGS